MNISYKPSDREKRKLRVAAYCRVSTLKDSQDDSYSTQVAYYERYIKAHEDWIYAGIYADQGISGTGTAKRTAFLKMIDDALNDKIDLILVKSISRFSRNIVDLQRYVDLLHSNGVDIQFEKEGISTADPSSFLIFGLMSSVAQSESESISQNIRWSNYKRQKQGIYKLGSIFGYDLNGRPNEDAEIVRLIYNLFLMDYSYTQIADRIFDYQKDHNTKKKLKFPKSEISYILHNEAYVGDKILQKQPPKNYLTKKPDKSLTYESFYVENGHTAIIDRETWNKVQEKLEERKQSTVHFNPGRSHFLYGKVFCVLCGAPYMRRNIGKHKTWVCKNRFKGHHCDARNIREDQLMKDIASQMEWSEVTQEKAKQIKKINILPQSIIITKQEQD